MFTSQSVASLYSFSRIGFILVLPSSHDLFLPQDLLNIHSTWKILSLFLFLFNSSSVFRINLAFTFFRKPLLTCFQRSGLPIAHFHGNHTSFPELFVTKIKNIKPDQVILSKFLTNFQAKMLRLLKRFRVIYSNKLSK